jgi:hypothetical protein
MQMLGGGGRGGRGGEGRGEARAAAGGGGRGGEGAYEGPRSDDKDSFDDDIPF